GWAGRAQLHELRGGGVPSRRLQVLTQHGRARGTRRRGLAAGSYLEGAVNSVVGATVARPQYDYGLPHVCSVKWGIFTEPTLFRFVRSCSLLSQVPGFRAMDLRLLKPTRPMSTFDVFEFWKGKEI